MASFSAKQSHSSWSCLPLLHLLLGAVIVGSWSCLLHFFCYIYQLFSSLLILLVPHYSPCPALVESYHIAS